VSGVLRQDRGNVIAFGRDVSRKRPSERARLGIGRTFQITRLFSNLSALENVMIALHYGSPAPATKERALEILEEVGLSHMANEKASSLSLAQRKRLELARALALDPRILLLDETFSRPSFS